MIRGHDIVCFSTDWRQDPLSKHHIMSRLAKGNRVLWINSIGMRNPTLSRKDALRVWQKLKGMRKRPQQVADTITVTDLLSIPFHGSGLARAANSVILKAQIRRLASRLGFRRPIVWTFLPTTAGVMDTFPDASLSIYHITDDFTQFAGYPAEAIGEMERRLITGCDLTVASAQYLADKKMLPGRPIPVVRHGVDHAHFSRALAMTRADWPKDIRNLPRPVVGFYGELNHWLDLPMLARAAALRPDWSWVLIGRIGVEVGDISFLTRLPNVHHLGHKGFAELPAYCAAFDVALIPMKVNELTRSVNPLKLREYLSSGVPVVSAPLPEVLPYGGAVQFAETEGELVAAVESWLAEERAPLARRLSALVEPEGWDAKVEELSVLIEEALRRKARP
jgi:glycosyltransferase involved in cell wall biosynthesis